MRADPLTGPDRYLTDDPGGGKPEVPRLLATLDEANAALGTPVPIAYGYHRVRGNLLLQGHFGDQGTRIALVRLGEGEWDGIDRLWINRKLVSLPDGNIHFHPGVEGTLGAGMAATSTGGDQLVDSHFGSLSVDPVTLSRTAYLMMKILPDAQAPGPDLDWIGDFRTLKLRTFDNTGTQTGYVFSTNPAWQILDLKLRIQLKPEGRINEALTAAELARIDWPSWKDAADYCDQVISGTGTDSDGQKRFESSFAWPQIKSFGDIESQLLMSCRGWIADAQGKLQLRIDQPRSATFVLLGSHVDAQSVKPNKKTIKGAPNRFVGNFRDLSFKVVATIATIASDGAGLVSVTTSAAHPFLTNDTIEITGTGNATWDKPQLVTNVIDNLNFQFKSTVLSTTLHVGSIGTPESRMMQRSIQVDHEAHQMATGQRGAGLTVIPHVQPQEFDFGSNTAERVNRLLHYIKERTLGPDTTPYLAPKEIAVTASLFSISNSDSLLAQVPGDVVTVDATVTDEFADDYVLVDESISKASQANASGATIELNLREYIPSAFTDAADATADLQVEPSAGRFTPVNTDGTLDTFKYHTSAFRNKAGTVRSGTTTTSDTWVTVASFTLHIPPGFTKYLGTITLSRISGGTPSLLDGRLKVGSLVSNTVHTVSGGSGVATVAGITPDTDITVEVQLYYSFASVGGTMQASFTQNQYTDQDVANLG
jgi:hypothetical protein